MHTTSFIIYSWGYSDVRPADIVSVGCALGGGEVDQGGQGAGLHEGHVSEVQVAEDLVLEPPGSLLVGTS